MSNHTPMPITPNAPTVLMRVKAGYARHSSAWGSAIKKALRHPKADDCARQAFQDKRAVHGPALSRCNRMVTARFVALPPK